MNDYNHLINSLVERGWLKTPRIIEAFRKIKREDFLPPEMKEMAEVNEALAIGYGQTISQPLVVAFMLELLNPEKGEKVLDIGSGSGWTTALIAELIKPTGKVIALEIVPELFSFGRDNVAQYGFLATGIVSFFNKDASGNLSQLVNLPDFSTGFDKILSSAALKKKENEDILESLPLSWRYNLKTGGSLVTPINSSIWFFSKKRENNFTKKEYPGFSFVPLVNS
jgi:protein-L-isoaspartate(D-aspartate) O-methyltransferase